MELKFTQEEEERIEKMASEITDIFKKYCHKFEDIALAVITLNLMQKTIKDFINDPSDFAEKFEAKKGEKQ